MKICYFLYAEARTLKTAVKTWNILNHDDVDVIVFTQTTSVQKSKCLNIEEVFNVDEEYIKKYLPTATVYLEDRNNYLNNEWGHFHTNFYAYKCFLKILNSINKKYDFIIINRLDTSLYIHDIQELINNYDKKSIYVNQGIIRNSDNIPIFIQDHFFMGSFENVKYVIENIPHPSKLEDSHGGFAKYLDSLPFNITDYSHNLFCVHVRPNMCDLIESFITTEKILDKDDIFLSSIREFMTSNTHLKLSNEWKCIKN